MLPGDFITRCLFARSSDFSRLPLVIEYRATFREKKRSVASVTRVTEVAVLIGIRAV